MISKINEKEVLNAITRTELSYFVQHMFHHFDGSQKFIKAPYIDVLADKLTQCYEGKIKRLIINIPPRSLKSFSTSIAFPAWVLGHKPNTKIVCVSYSQDLADKHGRDTLKIMESDLYKKIFKTRINPNKCSGNDFETTEHGYRFATSVGGTLTGRGGDIIIIDDPIKPEDAFNSNARNGLMDWYRSTLYSRLNNQTEGVIIVVMQRLHIDDLTGQLLKQGGWDLLNLPLIAKEDDKFELQNGDIIERKTGDILIPELWSPEAIKNLRYTISDYNFESQYQQNPVPIESNIIKQSWLKYFDLEPIGYYPNNTIYQSWDLACTTGKNNDYSVCITCSYINNMFHIIDIFRDKLEFPDLKNAILQKMREYRCKAENVIIEKSPMSTYLIQSLKENNRIYVGTYTPKLSKVERLNVQSPKIRSGRLFIPKQAIWKEDFINELMAFPNGNHDDQVDALTQLLDYIGEYNFYDTSPINIPRKPSETLLKIDPVRYWREARIYSDYIKLHRIHEDF